MKRFIPHLVVVILLALIPALLNLNRVQGSATLGGSTFPYKLERVHSGPGDHLVVIQTHNTEIQGTLEWRPLDRAEWRTEVMQMKGAALMAAIPHQAHRRIAYRVRLVHVGKEILVPPEHPVVLEFR